MGQIKGAPFPLHLLFKVERTCVERERDRLDSNKMSKLMRQNRTDKDKLGEKVLPSLICGGSLVP